MKTETPEIVGGVNMARRSFLRYAGIGAASAGLLATAACSKLDTQQPHNSAGSIDIGSGDIGILNFAYALEQLEAAFYIQVTAKPYSGISSLELTYLTAIRDHEILHRNFFKAAIGASAIASLTVNFSSIDFTNRTSVLTAARGFEDLGVEAYDGAGYLIQNPEYLTLAGKIVSVEARHAALIRNLLEPGTFVGPDVVASDGLNDSATIAQVLGMANTFLTTKVSASHYNYIAS
jgi:hypothetical protein